MRVFYPGLTSHKGHDVGARQMKGPGGMISFELAGGLPAATAFLESLRVFACAESLTVPWLVRALFAGLEAYSAVIDETHHVRKQDAPSGTALKLRDILREALGGGRDVPVTSTREGDIPGIHRVTLESNADRILLVHEARSREGFAAGALLAARWIAGRRGVYLFADVLDELLTLERTR